MKTKKTLAKRVAEKTLERLYRTALRLYERKGISAVVEWGDLVGLPSAYCEWCGCETPAIRKECAGCGQGNE